VITILQPDLSKTVASRKRSACGHGLRLEALDQTRTLDDGNHMAASIHFLAAIDNAGYFEADVRRGTCSATALVGTPIPCKDGCVRPLEKPGVGVEVDEEFLVKHPVIEGPVVRLDRWRP